MDSILLTIKKLLGIDPSYNHFDVDLIIHINSVFAILKQLGVKSGSYSISGPNETWSDYFGENTDLELIKSYMFAKVRMLFDPPTSSAVAEAMNHTINEFEWRINVTVDPSNQNEG